LLFLGKFGKIAALGTGTFDRTYVTDVKQSSNSDQCLDFYYYITDTTDNAKMQVGWKTDDGTQSIVDVTALSTNEWQHRQTNFTGPSTSYQVSKIEACFCYVHLICIPFNLILAHLQNDA
jgi:hypothetical protein